MATCTFTGSAGTDLSSYSAGGEPTWAEHGSYTAGAIILSDANRCRSGNAGTSLDYSSDTPASADYTVSADMYCVTDINSAGVWTGLALRIQTGSDAFYGAVRYQGTWRIYKRSGGTYTVLGSITTSLSTNTNYAVVFGARGSYLWLSVGGTIILRAYDGTISAAGKGGILTLGSTTNSTGIHIDNWVLSDLSSYGVGTNITITSPEWNRIFQRTHARVANIPITGTYTGSPTAIEASIDGSTWTTIDAAPAGGNFSGTLSNVPEGQYTLTCRWTNDTSKSATMPLIGVGEVFIMAGQSNMSGQFANKQQWTGTTYSPGVFCNDYHWRTMADPIDNNANQTDAVSDDATTGSGNAMVLLADKLQTDLGVPVGMVPCSKGATAILSWQPGANHSDRTTLYGSMNYRITQTGARCVLWWQGESDVATGTTQANYNSRLDTLANAINSDQGLLLFVTKLQDCTGIDETAVNAAIAEALGDNSNVKLLMDVSDQTVDDGSYHFTTDVHAQLVRDRAATQLETYLATPTAPTIGTATANSSSQITVTWTDNSSDETGFVILYDTSSSFTNPSSTTASAGATSKAVTGLSGSTTYYFKVKASSSILDSVYSSSANATTPSANNSPVATVSSPSTGSVSIFGQSLSFAGSGTDPEGGAVTYSWSSSLDGVLSTSASFSTSGLSKGKHTVTLTVTDPLGATGTASVAVYVNTVNL